MTYCLGIITSSGIVIAADSRTNAGVDYASTYRKLFDFIWPGERVFFLCTSGNLSATQGVLTALRKDIKVQADLGLHNVTSMYEAAQYVGEKVRDIQARNRTWMQQDGIDFQCSVLLGGQLKGEDPELYLIYSQGNFIQATQETTYLQIGETKYGKPILDRTLTFDTSLNAAAKCALISIDSTMKSNISVGPPINLIAYQKDSFSLTHQLQLKLGDPYLVTIRRLWEAAIKDAFNNLPDVDWHYQSHRPTEELFTD